MFFFLLHVSDFKASIDTKKIVRFVEKENIYTYLLHDDMERGFADRTQVFLSNKLIELTLKGLVEGRSF